MSVLLCGRSEHSIKSMLRIEGERPWNLPPSTTAKLPSRSVGDLTLRLQRLLGRGTVGRDRKSTRAVPLHSVI